MANANNDFGAGGDFRSKPDNSNDDNDQAEETPIERRANEYVRAILGEKVSIEQDKHPIAIRLLDNEINKVQSEGRGTKRDAKFVNIYRDKPVKVTCRVLVPLKEHPKFNFMGKLLGPKGNSLKRLQEDTMCKMAILGRGSMRDSKKEDELRNSLDIKYAHLSEDLHVEITALAPPAEAYARLAFALTELQKYLIPDGSDDISKGQLIEMGIYEERPPKSRPGIGGPGPMRRGGLRGGPPSRPTGAAGPGRGPPRMSAPGPRGPAGKPSVFSILDRARASMEQSYDDSYEEPYEPESAYDDFSSSGPSRSGFGGGNRFGSSANYDNDYYNDNRTNFSENQRWKPYKAGGAAARPEQTRYRPTPYSRGK